MPCTPFKLPNGATGIFCHRSRTKRCGWCTQGGQFLCDWKLPGGKTCDKPICSGHAQEVAADKHLCPEHQAAYAVWKAKRSAKVPA